MGERRNQREMRKYFEMNENEDTTYQNLWHVANAVLRGKIIADQDWYQKRKKISNQ